jgi:hypothetical protein
MNIDKQSNQLSGLIMAVICSRQSTFASNFAKKPKNIDLIYLITGNQS